MQLPKLPENVSIPANLQMAYHEVRRVYRRGKTVLNNEGGDVLTLKVAADALSSQTMPLVAEIVKIQGVPRPWASRLVAAVEDLEERLRSSARSVEDVHSNVVTMEAVRTVKKGRGRPEKEISPELLRQAMDPSIGLSICKLASALGVHRNTVSSKMKKMGVKKKFTRLSTAELEKLIREYREKRPDSGVSYVMGWLRSRQLRIQRSRVRDAVQVVDNVGVKMRQRNPIKRRNYWNPRPNAVWHLDGHHKAIDWGIVVHAFVDGYSRKIVAMKVGTRNDAGVVFRMFRRAVKKFGRPSRMRGDRGWENLKVAVDMIRYRGAKRGSFMFGSSTRNTRIERMWVEVGRQFMRRWRGFFTRLGRKYRLNQKNPHHIWLVGELFVDNMNEDSEMFVQEWNSHGLHNARVGHMTPDALYLTGQIKHGRPVRVDSDSDDADGDPKYLFRALGVDGHQGRHVSGAGHGENSADSDPEKSSTDSNFEFEELLMMDVSRSDSDTDQEWNSDAEDSELEMDSQAVSDSGTESGLPTDKMEPTQDTHMTSEPEDSDEPSSESSSGDESDSEAEDSSSTDTKTSSSESSELESDATDIPDITARVRRQINPKPVKTPRRSNPFEGEPASEKRFWDLLADAQSRRWVPRGYGFHSDEDGEAYEELEYVTAGSAKSNKRFTTILPRQKFEPLAVYWTQALEILTRLQLNL